MTRIDLRNMLDCAFPGAVHSDAKGITIEYAAQYYAYADDYRSEDCLDLDMEAEDHWQNRSYCRIEPIL